MVAKATQYAVQVEEPIGGTGGPVPTVSAAATATEDAERRRQILAILEQGDQDIAAGNGRDWDAVKQRMRDRISARLR